MTLTSHRVIQYVVILLLSLGVGVSWYEWQKSRAALKINTQAETAPTEGLVGYWKLDETTGTSVADSSGNGLTGTATNTENGDWVPGRIANGLDLDGTNEFVSVGDQSQLEINSSSLTASVWFYADSYAANNSRRFILSKGGAGGLSYEYEAAFSTANFGANHFIRVSVYQNNLSAYLSADSNEIALNTWYHLTFVYNRNANSLSVYINGVLASVDNTTTGTIHSNRTSSFSIGERSDSADDPFDGKLDEARIYNRALSDAEVRQLYQYTGPSGLNAGLVAHYTFDEPDVEGTTVFDRSGNGNVATLSNSPAPSRAPGRLGQAFSFTASPNTIASNSSSTTTGFGTSDFSFAAWAKTGGYVNQGSAINTIIAREYLAIGASGYGIGINSSHLPVCYVSTDGVTSGGTQINDNTWHYFVLVRRSNVVECWMDGLKLTDGATTSNITGSRQLYVGNDGVGAGIRGFNGSVDDVRLYNRSLSTTEIQSLYQLAKPDVVNNISQKDVLSESLAGYWKLDDGSGVSATDSSGANNTGTLTNGPTWTTGQIGGAVDFNGSTHYISTADNVYNAHTRGTVSAWIRMTTPPTTGQGQTIFGGASASNSVGLATFGIYNDGTFVRIRMGANNNNDYLYGNSALVASNWYHVVATSDGSTTRLYVDGVPQTITVQTGSNTGKWFASSVSGTMRYSIGNTRRSTGDIGFFNGQIDEVRVYDRPFSPDEVQKLFHTTAPSGVDTGLVGYWPMNGDDISGTTAFDRSGRGNNGTMTNGPQRMAGKIGQALLFDGSNDYVTSSTSPSVASITQTTVSGWIYPRDKAGVIFCNFDTFCYQNPPFSWRGFSFDFNVYSGTAQLRFSADFSGGSDIHVASKLTVPLNQWSHVAVSWDGGPSTDGVKFYINGADVGVSASSSSAGTFVPGTTYYYFGNLFNGNIDELRVHNRVLTPGEIRSLYDYGKSDKVNTASTSPLSEGLAGYWKFDDGSGVSATDSSGNSNTGTLANGPTWTTGQIGGAASFDGIDDWGTVTYNSTLTTTYQTYSLWLRPDLNESKGLLGSLNGEDGSTYNYLVIDNSGSELNNPVFRIHRNIAGSTTIRSTTPVSSPTNTWIHFTYTYDGVYERAYVNGIQVGEWARTGSFASNTEFGLLFARDYSTSAGYFKGLIDEVRVYNRALSRDEVQQLYRTTAPSGVDTGLVGYWPMNGKDISGTTVLDRSGRGSNGTMTNGPQRMAGKIGQALDFFPNRTDADAYVNVGDPASGVLDFGTGDFTLTLWASGRGYVNQISSMNGLINKRANDSGANVAGYRLYVDAGNKYQFYLADGSSFSQLDSGVSANDNVWHQLVAVRSGGSVQLYADGAPVGSQVAFSGNISTNASFAIGTDAALPAARNFNGLIDEVRLYNRALSSDEILGLYNRGK